MKKQEKLQLLRNFKEIPLIENVIRPLLEKMGFQNITLTHGAGEHGLDLVCFEQDKFGEREYIGIQVKTAKIHGSAGKKGNATEIFNQAQQAFTHSFIDINDNKEKRIDKYIVMTSGEITHDARDSICGQLKTQGYLKSIQLFDGNKLADLVDQWMPDFFWEEYNYFNRYFNEMKKDFETIKDISAIGQKETVNLEDIYVSLKLGETIRQRDLPMEIEKEETAGKIFDETIMEKRKELEGKRERVIEPESALKQFHRMVIVGAPGAGKTTLLKHLALKNCQENIQKQERTTVPIPITLREFFQSGKSLREYIDAVFDKYGFPEASKFVEKDLEEGKFILFLDGFDELAARENQEKVTWQRSFLLRQISVETYDFLHLSFQEYFTALELKEQQDGIGTIIEHIDQPWWEEPILLYAGICKDAGPLIARIQKEVPEDMFYSNLMLSGKCIADAEFTEPGLKEDIAQKLWSLYQNREFPLLKKIAMDVLRRMKPRTIIDSLILQLNDDDPGVRRRAAHALGAIGSRDAVPSLLKTFTSDKDSDVRRRAAEALGANGSRDVVPSLLKALTSNKEREVRAGAAYTLGAIGSNEAVTSLIKALTSDKDSSVRWEVASALGAIGSRDAVPALLKALTADKDSSVRGHAALALGAIGSREAVPALLKALIADKGSSVRWSAAEALGVIGDDTVTPSLLKALEDEEETIFTKEYHKQNYDMKVKDAAFEALHKISRRLGVRIVPEDT